MRQLSGLFCLMMLFQSCNWFSPAAPEDVVARVYEEYLTRDDLARQIPEGLSAQDSMQLAQTIINTWATETLLIGGAMRNLSEDEQQRFEALVEGYKNDLYTRSYKEALIAQRLDTAIAPEIAAEYYEREKENFILNEPLLKLRYVHVAEDYNNLSDLKYHFTEFDEESRYALDSLSLQFKSYFLNDSIWVKRSQVIQQIPIITSENANDLLKKTNFLQLRDSLGLYLIAVRETLDKMETAPLAYVRPTIHQIILNRRKLELVEQLEKEIKEDALKDKNFEIYN